MSQVVTGVAAVVAGRDDVMVLAELISSIDYESLAKIQTNRPLTVTKDQFDLFIARQGRTFMEVGLLDEELSPTGAYTVQM